MQRLRHGAPVLALSALLFALNPIPTPAQPPKKPVDPPATDPATMEVAKGFTVELLFSVPKDEMGSWVSMCVDHKGRLIVSDQYGALYRVKPRGLPGNQRVFEPRKYCIPADEIFWRRRVIQPAERCRQAVTDT